MTTRNKGIDLMKAMAMFFVVSLHAGTWHADLVGGGVAGCLEYAFRILAEGVPIFVAVNGFLVFGKREFVLRTHLMKTLRLFLLLVFWSVFLVIAKAAIWGEPVSVGIIVVNAFPSSIIGSKYTGPLWFLQSLIALYLFVPVLKHIYDGDKVLFRYLYWMSLAAWCTALLLGYVASPLGEFAGTGAFRGIADWIGGFMPASASSFILFFMTGGMCRLNSGWISQRRIPVMGLGFAAWVVAFAYAFAMTRLSGVTYPASFNYSSPFTFAMLFGWFALAGCYRGRVRAIDRFVSSVGRSTMGIYLLHTIVIAAFGEVVSVASLAFPLRVAFLLVVFISSWLLALLCMKIPGIRALL